MMTFRKLAVAAEGCGKLMRKYFTENTPEPAHDPAQALERQLDSGGRLTAYYTSRDSRATWRPDMPAEAAEALGINPRLMPRDVEMDRLFEGRRADNGEAWSKHDRKVSAYDFTASPHKSVTLAAEFAPMAAEGAAIWHCIDRAHDAAMRYIARELGWARKGAGGRGRGRSWRESAGSASATTSPGRRCRCRMGRMVPPTSPMPRSTGIHKRTSTGSCSTWSRRTPAGSARLTRSACTRAFTSSGPTSRRGLLMVCGISGLRLDTTQTSRR